MTNQYTAFRFISDTHKECSSCGEIMEHSSFHKDKRNKRARGLAYYCKNCANQKSRKWHSSNTSNTTYKTKKRNSYIKHKHGITLQEYEARLETQNFECAICGVELPTSGSATHMDHCHKTGKLRALLCTNCNRGLGHFQDNRSFLMKAIQYLNAHSGEMVPAKEVALDE